MTKKSGWAAIDRALHGDADRAAEAEERAEALERKAELDAERLRTATNALAIAHEMAGHDSSLIEALLNGRSRRADIEKSIRLHGRFIEASHAFLKESRDA